MSHFLNEFTLWDVALILVATAQGLLVAYSHSPRLKAFFWGMPFPFTVAVLAGGQPVNATHVWGMVLLFLFFKFIYWLYRKLKLPISVAIFISFLAYCGVGSLIAPLIPKTSSFFWISELVVALLMAALFIFLPHQEEPGFKSDLPVVLKALIIAGVIFILLLLKKNLQGFMTVAPMLGVVAAYEVRHSLWTFNRKVPLFALNLLPLLAVSRWLSPHVGLAWSLVGGWIAFLLVMIPIRWEVWTNRAKKEVSE